MSHLHHGAPCTALGTGMALQGVQALSAAGSSARARCIPGLGSSRGAQVLHPLVPLWCPGGQRWRGSPCAFSHGAMGTSCWCLRSILCSQTQSEMSCVGPGCLLAPCSLAQHGVGRARRAPHGCGALTAVSVLAKQAAPMWDSGAAPHRALTGHSWLCSFAWTLFAFLHNVMRCLAKRWEVAECVGNLSCSACCQRSVALWNSRAPAQLPEAFAFATEGCLSWRR